MKNKWIIFLLFFSISACNFSEARNIAASTPPNPTASPFIRFGPPPTPTITLSPTVTVTPTVPPYTGNPLSIVFIRGGNLWLATIGQNVTERQLTFEPREMPVISFDISPDETRIAYIPYQREPLNSLVKLVDLLTGETRVILGKDDAFSESSVVWVDNAKIAYKNQDLLAAGFDFQKVRNVTTYIVYDLELEKQVQVTKYDYLIPSPNKHLWLGCFYGAEGCGHYVIRYEGSNKQYKLERSMELGWFLGWSPDSRFLLFNTVTSPDVCMSQLILIDTKTFEEKLITPKDKNVWSADFLPEGNMLIYKQAQIPNLELCTSGKVEYWLLNLDNLEPKKIPVEFQDEAWDFSWTPDGKRLVFFGAGSGSREHQVWSMNLDGSDSKPILDNVEEFKILSHVP
jgi:WD40 repeat protein